MAEPPKKQIPFPAYRGDESYVFVGYSHQDSAAAYSERRGFSQSLRGAGITIESAEGELRLASWSV